MGYDRRRAALLTLSLSALLLAATLMPAAGLGSFPGVDSGPGASDPSGSETDGQDTPRVTATETPTVSSPTPTPTETPTPTPTTDTATISPDPYDEDDDDESVLAFLSLLFPLIIVVMVLTIGYTGLIAGAVAIGGASMAAKFPLGEQLRTLPQVTMVTVIGLSGSMAQFARGFGDVVGAVGTGLGGLAGVADSVGGAVSALLTLPASAGRGVSLGFGSVFGSLGGALSALTSGSTTRTTTETSETTTDARTTAAVDPETPTEEETGPLSVREAWDRFTDELPVRNQFARTPAEIRDAAVEHGWPAEPVETLTETFREVRYGNAAESEDRLGAARRAIDALRPNWSDEE